MNNTMSSIQQSESTEIARRLKRNKRLMQMAAHALWVDATLEDAEVRLFEELTFSFPCDVKLHERDELESLDDICAQIESQEEKCQIMEIVCSMLTIDSDLSPSESQFVGDLFVKLGFSAEKRDELMVYAHELVVQNRRWSWLMA